MTATDELRRLLDERGVEWERGLPTETIVRVPIDTLYVERPDGRMHVYFRSYLTPEQAVAATLGRGTCEVEYVSDWMGWHCKTCDMLWQGLRDQRPRYCPNCGRRVE